MPLISFYTAGKHQKTFNFLILPGGCKKRPVTCFLVPNFLKVTQCPRKLIVVESFK